MTSCSCQHAQIQVAYRMHLEMGAKQGAFQRRCLGEERHRFCPHSQSVIANLRPPLYVAQCGCNTAIATPPASSHMYLFSPSKPRRMLRLPCCTPRNLACNAFDSEELEQKTPFPLFAVCISPGTYPIQSPLYDAQYEVVQGQYTVGKRLCWLCGLPLKKKTFR